VRQLTSEEDSEIGALQFDIEKYKDSIGVTHVKEESEPKTVLINKWCKPTLSIHGNNVYDKRLIW
jgi:hypothetical protein